MLPFAVGISKHDMPDAYPGNTGKLFDGAFSTIQTGFRSTFMLMHEMRGNLSASAKLHVIVRASELQACPWVPRRLKSVLPCCCAGSEAFGRWISRLLLRYCGEGQSETCTRASAMHSTIFFLKSQGRAVILLQIDCLFEGPPLSLLCELLFVLRPVFLPGS